MTGNFLKRLQPNQRGFIPLLIMLFLFLLVIIALIFLRVKHVQP